MHTPDRQLDYLHARQASAWLQALPTAGGEQRAAFVAWLKESPHNVRELLAMLALDQALERVDTQRLHDIQTLIAQANLQVIPFTPGIAAVAEGTASKFSLAKKRAALAAGIVAVAALATWWLQTRDAGEWKEFATVMGEQRAFELEDGSVIHLNTRSRVAWHFSKHARDVRLLEGEALFKVQHDTSRPFRVYTNDAVVQAVGTQFDVYDRPTGTFVSVIEGRVNLTPEVSKAARNGANKRSWPPVIESSAMAGKVHSLGAKESAYVDHAGEVKIRMLSDVSETIAWRERRLVFREQSLQNIVDEFNRYGRKHIRIEGNELATRVYSGVFDADDSESLAQALAVDPNLNIERSHDEIVIRTR